VWGDGLPELSWRHEVPDEEVEELQRVFIETRARKEANAKWIREQRLEYLKSLEWRPFSGSGCCPRKLFPIMEAPCTCVGTECRIPAKKETMVSDDDGECVADGIGFLQEYVQDTASVSDLDPSIRSSAHETHPHTNHCKEGSHPDSSPPRDRMGLSEVHDGQSPPNDTPPRKLSDSQGLTAYTTLFGLPLPGDEVGCGAVEDPETSSAQHKEGGWLFAPANTAGMSTAESKPPTPPQPASRLFMRAQVGASTQPASPTISTTQQDAIERPSTTQFPAKQTLVDDDTEAVKTPRASSEEHPIDQRQVGISDEFVTPAEGLQVSSPTRHDSPAEDTIHAPRSSKRKRRIDDEAAVESPPTKRRRRVHTLGPALIPARRYSL
jgi:hypothetical protein